MEYRTGALPSEPHRIVARFPRRYLVTVKAGRKVEVYAVGVDGDEEAAKRAAVEAAHAEFPGYDVRALAALEVGWIQ